MAPVCCVLPKLNAVSKCYPLANGLKPSRLAAFTSIFRAELLTFGQLKTLLTFWRVAKFWPDWAVCWHKDAFEFQCERAEGLLCFPSCSRDVLEKRVTEMLLVKSNGTSVDLVLQMAEQSRIEGKNVEINPWALRDDRLNLPIDVRREIVARAIGRELTS